MTQSPQVSKAEEGMGSTSHFFTEMVPVASFDQAILAANHRCLPRDWWVVITDVVNSTVAIQRGRYKDVNTIGACVIMAAINLDRGIEIPYVFGGDGATLAVPPELETGMRQALLATRALAQSGFDLDLRTAMIPVRDLEAAGKNTKVTKYQQSSHMCLASFSGDGWAEAEAWAKGADTSKIYAVTPTAYLLPQASYEGFECRWQSVPRRRDHKVCVVVSPAPGVSSEEGAIMHRVMDALHGVFTDFAAYHPLTEAQLSLSLNPLRLTNEAKVRLSRLGTWQLMRYVAKTLIINILGMVLFRFRIKTKTIDWGAYKPDFVANADFHKFDGSLKMILDSTEEKTAELEARLEALYREKKIVYGLHRSDAAILTCLVFSYSGHHAHFVDGSAGGYALAALDLKHRRRQLLEGGSSANGETLFSPASGSAPVKRSA